MNRQTNRFIGSSNTLVAAAVLTMVAALSGGFARAEHVPTHGVGSGGEFIQMQLQNLQSQIDDLPLSDDALNNCADGEVAKSDGAGNWSCQADDNDDTLGALDSCGSGQVAKWTGTAWDCGDDVDTTDTDWNSLSNVPAGLDDGDDNTDTLEDLASVCDDGDIVQLDPSGSGEWFCLSPAELKGVLGLPFTVFKTSQTFTGDLVTEANTLFAGTFDPVDPEAGLDAADHICTSLANADGAVVPPGAYVAWLSASVADARDRIPQTGPYIRPDGAKVALTLSALLDTFSVPLINSIRIDEFGDDLFSAVPSVWTGTQIEGFNLGDSNCQDWTDSTDAEKGASGQFTQTGVEWTFDETSICINTYHLYCFQK